MVRTERRRKARQHFRDSLALTDQLLAWRNPKVSRGRRRSPYYVSCGSAVPLRNCWLGLLARPLRKRPAPGQLARSLTVLFARHECRRRFRMTVAARGRPRMQPILAMGHRHHELALVALERAQLRYPGKARFKLYEPHRLVAHWARWTVYFNAVRCRHEQRLRPALPILLVLNPCLQRWKHVKLGYGLQCATTLRTNSTSRQADDDVQRLGL
jgi:hypothetical protein